MPPIGYPFLALVLLYLLALPAAEQRGSHLGLVSLLLLGAGLLLGATSILSFYLGWELAALAAWGIGRLATETRSAAAFPLGPAGLFGTILMLAALLIATSPTSIAAWLAFSPHLSGLSALLLIGAVLLKVAGALATLRDRVVGSRLDPGPSLLVGPTLLLVGVYPALRLLGSVGAVESWRGLIAVGCALLALAATLAALGERDVWVALGRGALGSLGFVWWSIARGGDAATVALGAALAWTGLGLALALVTRAAGDTDVRRLGGVAERRPLIALAAIPFVLALPATTSLSVASGGSAGSTAIANGPADQAVLLVVGIVLLQTAFLARLFGGAFFGPARVLTMPTASRGVSIALFLVGVLVAAGLPFAVPGQTWLRLDASAAHLPLALLALLSTAGTFGFSLAFVGRTYLAGRYHALMLIAAVSLSVGWFAADLTTLGLCVVPAGVALAALTGLDFTPEAGRAATAALARHLGFGAVLAAAAALVVTRGGSLTLDGLLAREGVRLGDPARTVLIVAFLALAGLAPLQGALLGQARRSLTPVVALALGVEAPLLLVSLGRLATGLDMSGYATLVRCFGVLSVGVGLALAARSADFRVWCAGPVLVSNGLAALAAVASGPAAAPAFAGLVAASIVLLPVGVLGIATALRGRGSVALADFAASRGSWRATAALALFAVGGLVGVPPLPGYDGRVRLVDALLAPGVDNLALLLVVLVAVALLPASLWRFVAADGHGTARAESARRWLAAPLVLLAVVGGLLALGIPSLERLAGVRGAVSASGWRDVGATALVGLALALGALTPLARAGALGAAWAVVMRADKRLRSPGARLAAKGARVDWLTLDLGRPVDAVARLLSRLAAFGFEVTLGRLGRG